MMLRIIRHHNAARAATAATLMSSWRRSTTILVWRNAARANHRNPRNSGMPPTQKNQR